MVPCEPNRENLQMTDTHFDAVIVGSGFGGSVMAYRLAEAGLDVCLLERGRSFPPFSFPRAPHKLRNNFWDPSEGLYGLYNIWSFKGSGSVVSSGLGGGSLIYANVLIRKDEKWFINEDLKSGGYESWPVTRKDLDPHYDRVAAMMNIQQYPIHRTPYDRTAKTWAMEEAARKLREHDKGVDAHWQLLDLAVSFRRDPVTDPKTPDDELNPPVIGEPINEKPNIHGKTRYTCVLCGECDLGCNTGSKNTLDYTYISAAHRSGADIRDLCEVKAIAPKPRGGYQVDFLRHDPGRWEGIKVDTSDVRLFPLESITCDRLILSAGTFGSPFLLFKNRSLLTGLSERLGSRFGVNGDLLSFIIRSREKTGDKCVPRVLDPSFGPVITSAIRLGDTLDDRGDQGRGFYVEDGGHPYLLGWGVELTGFLSLLRRSVHFASMFTKYRIGLNKDADLDAEIADLIGDCTTSKSSMPVLTMGRDIPNGTLSFDGKYLDCDWDPKESQDYYDRVTRIVRSIADALNAEYMDNPSYRYLHQVLTAHPLGGCAMADDKGEGVVDQFGEVFGHEGLFVVDGSIMPGPVGPNPSMTIAAIADRAADAIIQKTGRRRANGC